MPPPSPTMEAHILVVDDDPAICDLVRDYLVQHDLEVTTVASGEEMDQALGTHLVDLVVLDLQLPGEDGFAIARRLRDKLDLPIIMLTGRGDEADRVQGLEMGADDYVTKPFSQRELLARIHAVLRRTESKRLARRADKVRAYRFAGWELNTGLRRLKSPDGRTVEVTNSEYALLVAFLRAPQRVLSRDALLESSRLHDDIYDRSIDVQILRLRRKIEEKPNEPALIRTERGAGYLFDARVETVS